jgi:hypothetical protein
MEGRMAYEPSELGSVHGTYSERIMMLTLTPVNIAMLDRFKKHIQSQTSNVQGMNQVPDGRTSLCMEKAIHRNSEGK